jgi:hypothetical protein
MSYTYDEATGLVERVEALYGQGDAAHATEYAYNAVTYWNSKVRPRERLADGETEDN